MNSMRLHANLVISSIKNHLRYTDFFYNIKIFICYLHNAIKIHKGLLYYSAISRVGNAVLILHTRHAFHTVFIKIITEPSSLNK